MNANRKLARKYVNRKAVESLRQYNDSTGYNDYIDALLDGFNSKGVKQHGQIQSNISQEQ